MSSRSIDIFPEDKKSGNLLLVYLLKEEKASGVFTKLWRLPENCQRCKT